MNKTKLAIMNLLSVMITSFVHLVRRLLFKDTYLRPPHFNSTIITSLLALSHLSNRRIHILHLPFPILPTMKFSAVTVVAALSCINNASAFGVHSNLAITRSHKSAAFGSSSSMRMSLDDLESKLLSDPAPAKGGAKKAPAPKKQTSKKVEKKVEAAPVPVPVPTPAPAKGSKKVKYVDLPTPPPAPKPAPAPKPERVRAAPKPKPEPKAKAVVAAPSTPVEKDPNAGTVGVALGAAPLLVAPLVALSAARGALGNTKARREAIQAEIAAKEAAKKKELTADVDAGGVIGALVSIYFVVVFCICSFVCLAFAKDVEGV